jgi:uncharacterized DUF497 family protein
MENGATNETMFWAFVNKQAAHYGQLCSVPLSDDRMRRKLHRLRARAIPVGAEKNLWAGATIPLVQPRAVTDMSRLHICPLRSQVDER